MRGVTWAAVLGGFTVLAWGGVASAQWHWDPATRSWAVAPGEYGVHVGNSSRSTRLAGTIRF